MKINLAKIWQAIIKIIAKTEGPDTGICECPKLAAGQTGRFVPESKLRGIYIWGSGGHVS